MNKLVADLLGEPTGVRHPVLLDYTIANNKVDYDYTEEYRVSVRLGSYTRIPHHDIIVNRKEAIEWHIKYAKRSIIEYIYGGVLSRLHHLRNAVYEDRTKLMGIIDEIEDWCLGNGIKKGDSGGKV